MQAEREACQGTLEHIDERLVSGVCDENTAIVTHPSWVMSVSLQLSMSKTYSTGGELGNGICEIEIYNRCNGCHEIDCG
jgi:hypothetical protein